MPNFGNELHALWELATEREDVVKESEDLEEHNNWGIYLSCKTVHNAVS